MTERRNPTESTIVVKRLRSQQVAFEVGGEEVGRRRVDPQRTRRLIIELEGTRESGEDDSAKDVANRPSESTQRNNHHHNHHHPSPLLLLLAVGGRWMADRLTQLPFPSPLNHFGQLCARPQRHSRGRQTTVLQLITPFLFLWTSFSRSCSPPRQLHLFHSNHGCPL